ncbi:DUF551 domain-containing protein [Klebsiella sp. K5-229]|nr:DUF551 domain-containing protein [Klebsiella sp. K5-229]MDK1987861.1 DUF551 domain-containing protein [Klebsiella sp. K6-123-1]
MTSKFSIDNRELIQRISSGEAIVGIDFGNLIVRELAAFRLAAMDSSESVELPLDYLQGHKDGLEWAAQLAEANHPEKGDWLYDDPIELAKAIRKGPDMPPAQPVADSEPVIVVGDDGGDALSYRRLIQSFEPGTKLYRHAQPAPACESITVTDDMAYAFHHALTDSMIGADDVEEIKTGLRAVFANLTAPVVSAEYPDRLPCSVLLEPGLRFGKGIKTSTMLAALARRAVYESDMAALSPEERAEFQARIEDFKALIAQPVPVVPQDVLEALQKVARIRLDLNDFDGDRRGIADCLCDAEEALIEVVNRRAAMLAAAPQSPGSEPATVPGKWIPVSERMPEVGDIVLTAMGGAVNVGEMECSAANCRFFTSVISGRELPATHWMPLPAAPQEAQGE